MFETDLRNSRILIVDDQPANVIFLQDFFAMHGYTNINSTTDSRKVIEIYIKYQPDLILLDLHMPYFSGFEIMEQLKDLILPDVYVPILVLTADITITTKRKALLCGASDFLSKPFDLVELQARINTHLLIKHRNEQIKRYNAELEMHIAMKDKFFSIIAHDVRNPFVGIKNYIDILLRIGNFSPSEMEENLKVIRGSAIRGHELLENLLKWTKSQSGRLKVKSELCNLKSVTNSSINLIEIPAANKNIHITNTIEEDLTLESDTEMLDTIVRNLLSNAIKFTPNNGSITLTAAKNKNYITISVTDTGIGIDNEKIENLFRIDKNLQAGVGTAGESGSGLGLILCKEFIDKLGGKIWVESEPNKGSSFIFSLPL